MHVTLWKLHNDLKINVFLFSAAVVPEFSIGIKKMQVEEGKSAKFECEVRGTPKPEVQW